MERAGTSLRPRFMRISKTGPRIDSLRRRTIANISSPASKPEVRDRAVQQRPDASRHVRLKCCLKCRSDPVWGGAYERPKHVQLPTVVAAAAAAGRRPPAPNPPPPQPAPLPPPPPA